MESGKGLADILSLFSVAGDSDQRMMALSDEALKRVVLSSLSLWFLSPSISGAG